MIQRNYLVAAIRNHGVRLINYRNGDNLRLGKITGYIANGNADIERRSDIAAIISDTATNLLRVTQSEQTVG